MSRRLMVSVVVSIALLVGAVGLVPAAGAATTTPLVLSQSAAFAILGHSCGGIQEHAYATGFGAGGYPVGEVHLETRCGGSGRGGGYKVTTYTAWANVTWNWYGETRSSARLEGPAEVSTSFSAEDAYGDRIYNTSTAAYLETSTPPLVAPAAPSEVAAAQSNIEVGEQLVLRFQVTWAPAAETAPLITSSTVTATPVGSSAPVLTATVSGPGTSAIISPLQPNTTYSITVTNTDAEGTSAPSTPVQATSPNSDGEAEGGLPPEAGPEFGRCVKVGGGGRFTSSSCETESATETGAYEWVRDVLNPGFTTAIKPTTTMRLEATSREKVTCTGATSSGQVTGPKTVGDVVMRFTGCESLGAPCTTSGLGEGELQTETLTGTLGILSTTEKEGKEIVHVGLSLQPAAATPVLEYTCNVSGAAIVSGAVIAPIGSGKMAKTTALKFTATAGKQKPAAFEGGIREVPINQLGEQVGLTLSSIQTNEEAFEVNPFF